MSDPARQPRRPYLSWASLTVPFLMAGNWCPAFGQVLAPGEVRVETIADISPDSMIRVHSVSPDGRRVVWSEGIRKRWSFRGLATESEVAEVGAVAYSPDSQRLAYYAKKNGKWRVILDGKEEPEFDGTPQIAFMGDAVLAFSPDSRHFAYVSYSSSKVLSSRQGRLVVDGTRWPEREDYRRVRFSPDSQHVAAVCRIDQGGNALILDGREYCRVDHVLGYEFNPASGSIAVLGLDIGSGRFASMGLAPNQPLEPGRRLTRKINPLVDPGGTGGIYTQGPVFSADGTHSAYAVGDEDQVDICVDSRSLGSFPGARCWGLRLSPDGTVLDARLNSKKGDPRMLTFELGPEPVTGKWTALQRKDIPGPAGLMSLSGKHFARASQKLHWSGPADRWVELDGREGPHFPGEIHGLRFISDDEVVYLAQSPSKLVRVWHRASVAPDPPPH